jgi:Cu/Ag efflux pump CusA
MIALGFAGKTVEMFWRRKRFDMVIRLNQANRQGIDDLKSVCCHSNGEQIPLQRTLLWLLRRASKDLEETIQIEEL